MSIFAMLSPQLQILGYVVMAMILGGTIGFEREQADKPAGLRTHMLVAGAAALLVNVGDLLTLASDLDSSLIRTDPIRVIEAIITGISFLGAGTILRRDHGDIEGLTTAASLFFVAGIGIVAGIGQFVLALSVTVLVLAVLFLAKLLVKKAQ